MGYLTSIYRINRYAHKEIPTARLSKMRIFERLVDVHLKSIALKVSYDNVRVFNRDNNIIPVNIDQSAIIAD